LIDIYLAAVLVLIAFHVIGNMIWIYLNNVPPASDAGLHTVLSLRFTEYIKTNLFNFNIIDFLKISNYYPPFTYLVGAFFGFVGNYNYKLIQFTGTLFLSLTFIFLYLYTSFKFKNRFLGILAIFFFGFYIYIYKESRDHMTDIPLTASYLAGLYFLEKSENFSRFKQTVFFFISFAIAFLTKWTAPIFFFIPLVYKLLKVKINKKIIARNIAFGLIVFLFLVSPWYMVNGQNILTLVKVYGAAAADNPQHMLSLENILFYPKLIIMFQLSFIGTLFFLLSCFLLLRNKEGKNWTEIGSIILFNYLFFTFFIGDKNVRILFPIMPFFALIMAYELKEIVSKSNYKIFSFLPGFIVCYYLFSYFILSFGFPIYPQYKKALNFPLIGWLDIFYWHHEPVKLIYDKTNWPNETLAKILLSKSLPGKKTFYFIDSERTYLNASTIHLSLYRLAKSIPSNFQEADTNFFHVLKGKIRFANYKEIDDYVNLIDILFIPLSEIGPKQAIRDYTVRKQIQEYMLNNINPNYYIGREEVSLPDGDTLRIYQRKF
jgi:4-amino-4-deoxy-L-arabinose transferase-like glycosyltransferase